MGSCRKYCAFTKWVACWGPFVHVTGHAAMQGDETTADEQDELQLRRALEVAKRSREHGNRPFGAVLVGPLGEQLLEAENTQDTARDRTGHAECNLVRLASTQFDRDYLAGCTLYASCEPCPMCAGAIYWSNVRRVVFALDEANDWSIHRERPATHIGPAVPRGLRPWPPRCRGTWAGTTRRGGCRARGLLEKIAVRIQSLPDRGSLRRADAAGRILRQWMGAGGEGSA